MKLNMEFDKMPISKLEQLNPQPNAACCMSGGFPTALKKELHMINQDRVLIKR